MGDGYVYLCVEEGVVFLGIVGAWERREFGLGAGGETNNEQWLDPRTVNEPENGRPQQLGSVAVRCSNR
jgi:hypothetical protein